MSNPDAPQPGKEAELRARLAARQEQVAGLRASLTGRKRALLEKLVEGRAGAAPSPSGIERRRQVGPAVLSFAQERLWFLDRLQPESPLYNLPAALRLTGRVDLPVLARSLDEIVRRHEVLRTIFVMVDGDPRQRVCTTRPAALPVIDLQVLPVAEREEEARRLRVAESLRPFDLTRGPLLRMALLRLTEADWIALFNLHHVVGDGWSFGLLIGELGTLYRAFAERAESPLPELPLQYSDFSAWQRDRLAGELLAAELAYWRREIDGAPVLLELPTDRSRPAVQSFRGEDLRFTLPRSLSSVLVALAESEGATLFMVLLAGFQALLGRLTGQDDLLVGSALANRTHRETERLIGFFINLLVFRGRLAGEPSFRQLLARVRTTALAAYAHQDLPFDKLVEELHLAGSHGHNPLVQAVLVLQNAPRETLELPGLVLRLLELPVVTAKFDLGLAVTEIGGELYCHLEYSKDLFDRSTVARVASGFERLLAGFGERLDTPLSDVPLLSAAERHQVQVEWGTAAGVERAPEALEPAWKAFERQARRRPEAVALVLGGGAEASLTYAELDLRASRLARRLRRLGVRPEVRVGLFAERSFDLALAILGIWKAGGAYLPLDPGLPSARLAFLIEDALGGSGAVLLVQEALRERLRDLPVGRLQLVFLAAERPDEQGGDEQDEEEQFPSRPEHLAYLIYTSGTTGRPKAVAVEHGNLSHTLAATGEAFGFSAADRMPCLAPFSFDIFLFELLAPLQAGGTVILFPLRPTLAVRELAAALPETTALHAVPALMREVIKEVAELNGEQGIVLGLRLVFVGGDAVPPELLAEMRRVFPAARVVVLYGPTEGTILVSHYEAGEETGAVRHPIGRPLPGAELRVFGRHGEPLPIGVPGELCLGGEGIARGYLGRPRLSAERFVPSPFAELGGRLYRTGDLVRFRRTGVLEFLGRIDTQVKIRGFRIEPGEVEAVLSAHPAVHQAVVLVREDRPGDRRLVAYVVGGPGEDLKTYLRERLPDYMVPAAIVGLAALPLTANGKVDRAALPAPDEGEDEAVRAAPRTVAEELMMGLWSQLLGVAAERISVDSNFFDLGGHSLLATRLLSRVREAFGVELPLRAVFEAPTVAGLTGLAERELVRGPESHLALPPPLVPAERIGSLQLSFAQERLWFLDQLEPGSAAYNIPMLLRFTGVLDLRALVASLAAVTFRHEILRTTFRPGAQGLQQVIAPSRPAELPVVSLEALPEDLRPEVAARLAREEAERPFDLERGPLVRGLALRMGAESHLLMLNLHHIVADGWSFGVLVREVGESYTALVTGRAPVFPALPIQYADYAIWQRRWLAGEELARQLAWWRERLKGAPEVLELPTDRPRPPFAGSAGRFVSIDLSPAVVDGVQGLARESVATPFMVLLAGFALLLDRVTGSSDLVVGSPIANRQRLETEGLIGLFINSLALRVEISRQLTFGELLAAVRATTLGAYAHQDLPFEMVVEALAPARSLGHTPLFQVMLALQNAPVSALELPGLRLVPLPLGGGRAKFDLTLNLVPGASRLAGTLEYRAELFDRSTIERLASGFERLLLAAVSLPKGAAMPVAGLPLLSAAERHQVAREWNEATSSSNGAAPLVAELFAGQVLRRPDAVALVARGWQLSYGELAARSRRLARRLRALGVGPDVRVGIALGASPHRVEAILAVVQAAGAYVALDPDYPEERLAYALADAAVPVILTERALLGRLPAISAISAKLAKSPATVICLDDFGQEKSGLPGGAAPASAGADHLAYVIYTSGSTGRPKGVEIPHRGLANLVRWHCELYSVGPEDRVTLVASPGFDASVLEMWPYLASGASLYLVEASARLSPEAMLGAWAEAGVTLPFLPTPLAEAVLDADAVAFSGTPVRILFTGGDRLHRSPATGSPFLLENLYGPTEYSVVSTVQRVVAGVVGVPPIGRPVANTRLAVVGPRGELVPTGVAGELYVGGAGLARGYLGRPDLTAERFVPDPLAAAGEAGEPGARSYRTGDLVRWLADGSLEFLGRTDHQVKIRGFRIETGEIEAVLAEHPEVLQAAVLVRADRPEDRRLVAYVLPRVLGGLSVGELRAHLKTRLPDFMLPASFVLLSELPLTANGKVDRRRLPAPELGRLEEGKEKAAPRTPVEELLAGLWAGLLGVDQVGIDDNFFELGGHSLLATRVVSRVREVFGVEIPVRELFDFPTVAGLAGRLAAGTGEAPPPPLRAAKREGELPLSFAQERLWFLDRLEPGGSAYNISAAVRLVGPLDGAAFGAALGEVVRRHEALRTGFREGWQEMAGRPVQVIRAWNSVGLPVVDLSVLSVEPGGALEEAVRHLAGEEAGRPFDLALGRPLRAALLRQSGLEHVLFLTVHHIAADGWSVGILIRELAALYEAFGAGRTSPLPELPIQYADFAIWQREWLSGSTLEGQTAYWRQALSGAPTLELPTDRPRPARRNPRGARREVTLPPGLSDDLQQFARGQGATVFMVLLTAFEILLGRISGQEDVLVGSPIANRNHREIEGLIGFFVNTLVLRGDLSGDPDFPTLVGRTREVTLAAYAHQDLPFEKLVLELAPVRDGSRTPLFQVMFTLQEAAAAAVSGFGDLAAEWLEVAVETAKFDLTLSLRRGEESGFVGEIEYSTDLFDVSTVMRLAGQLGTLLAAVAADPGRRLADLPLLSAAERHQLQVEWNALPSLGCSATLQARLARQSVRTPDAVAIVAGIDGGARLTYGELAARAARVGRRLRALDIGPGVRVGLSLERSPELVAGLLGILAAGGTYVPIDPAYPAERQSFMLRDAGLAAVVNEEWLAAVPEKEENAEDTENGGTPVGPAAGSDLGDFLYVIYTSGSTGQPKGAVVRERAFSGLVDWYIEELGLRAADRLLLLSSASFDLTQKNFFAPLLVGAELHLAPSAYDSVDLRATIERQGITRLNCTPSAFYPLAEEGDPAALASLCSVVLGGEPIAVGRLDHWRHSTTCRAAVINSYGPTECTDVVAFHRLSPPDGVEMGVGVPLGRPIAGARLWIHSGLAGTGSEPVPIGVPGELWVGGLCVGGGYLGDAARTAQKFLPDPSAQSQAETPGARAYRTGDLARRLPGGEIDFLGRIDHQVKLRGFRVELAEIEAALAAQPGVREAVVVAREIHPDRAGDLRLVAYVVPAEGDGSRLVTAELREALARHLPHYMVPTGFVVLAALPFTPSGKVDRRALAALSRSASADVAEEEGAAAFVAPRTPVEELLAGIWCELLNVERVGARDDFFALGGHSLLATQLASRLRAAFAVEMPLRRIFEAPTLERLAVEVEAARQGPAAPEEPALLPAVRGFRLPLSFAQERLWFLERFDPGNPSLNVPLATELVGHLSVPALAATLAELADRHESLRTTFETVAEEPCQKIHPAGLVALPEVDLVALAEGEARREANRLAGEQALRGFDLERGPLFRAALVRLADDRHRFLLILHHIVTDGWSMGVLLGELGAIYGALSQGQRPSLPPLPIQYADFALWQRLMLAGQKRPELDYWLDRLGGEVEPLDLPTDRPRPAVQSYRGEHWPLVLSADLTFRLRAFGRQRGVTLFMTLLAAAKALLYRQSGRQSGQDEILIGTPIAGRRRIETEGLIGFFLNTLVLRTDLSGSPSLSTLAARVRAVTLDAYAHQDVPFEAVLAGLKGERDLSRTPLFQVLFNMLNLPRGEVRLPGLTLSPVAGPEGVPAKFDLTFYVTESGLEIGIELVYNADLFDSARMADLADQYMGLLAQAVENPEVPLAGLSLVTEWARAVLPDAREELSTAWEGAVHELFAAEARRAPERVAVSDSQGIWSYGELDAVADRLAGWLLARGVAREDRVAIYAHRSASLVPAVLAVLKAGAAFTILDPAYPAARLVDMLTMASPRACFLVAASGPLPDEVESWFYSGGCPRLTLAGGGPGALLAGLADLSADLAAALAAELGAIAVGPDDLAYVAFTSGSTGSPKGILGRHGPLTHFLPWMRERFGLSVEDRFTLLSGLAHDPLQRDIFTPLCLGATILIPDPSEIPVAGRVAAWMAREGATVAHLTPAMAQLITEQPAVGASTRVPSLRLVFLVGEALTRLDVARIRHLAPEVTAVNLFGSTETQRAVGYHVVTPEEASGSSRGQAVLSLGRGMEDVQLLVLTSAGGLAGFAGIGEVGEIVVRSPHLARGYLNDPGLTAEKFRENPATGAAGTVGNLGDRLYHTGDLGRYLPNGEVTFAGRGDFQVKIRGFRVEPAEIEAALARHPAVAAAAALLREEGGERFLVALVVPRLGAEPSASELREHLLSELPSYMVPAAFTWLAALPLTPNGKLDRRALTHLVPALSQMMGEASGAYAAPRDATEELLADLWAGLLGLDRVGIDDNFFALGGHSLLATRLMSRVREVFGVELPVRALFDAPTVAGLAELLAAGAGEAPPPPLRPAVREAEIPLSFAQERLWFLDRLAPGAGAYNISAAVRLVGPLDMVAFGMALDEVVRRHEALRTRFEEGSEGRPVQVITAWRPPGLPLVDLSTLSVEGREAAVLGLAGEEMGRPFDLAAGRLMRGTLLRLAAAQDSSGAEHVILLTLHHIAADGWSLSVLVGELAVLYGAFCAGRPSPLPELPIQYADFSLWQRGWLSGAALEAQMAYWRQALAGAPTLELPTDRPRPAVRGSHGALLGVALPPGLSEDLRRLSRGQGATPFMVLLSIFEVLLKRQSGQEDLLVGSPIANRTHREVEGLIGFFVNTLVLRADLSGDPSFLGLLGRTREVSLAAYTHQDLPFEKLVSELAPVRDLSRTPLFQVMFNLQSAATAAPGFPGLTAERLEVTGETAKFDLTLSLSSGKRGDFGGSIEYSTDLFDRVTVMRLAGQMETLLTAAMEAPGRRLGDLKLLSAPERAALLVEWNDTRQEDRELPGESVSGVIEEQARRVPDAVAVVALGELLSYGELDRRSNRLARNLRRLGVGPEVLVGVAVERSLDMMVGLLGILKAGGAYVPLDPEYPQERLAYMLEQSRLTVLLTQEKLLSNLPATAARILALDRDWPAIERESDLAVASDVRPENLAYILYTSGSTGQPKGVQISHGALSNFLAAMSWRLGMTSADTLLAVTTLSFDIAGLELYLPLVQGAKVVLAPRAVAQNGQQLAEFLVRSAATVMQATPATWRLLLEAGWQLDGTLAVLCGGEALSHTLANALLAGAARLWNLYGPTETTIWSMAHEAEAGARIPIGRPLANTQVYLLSPDLTAVPVGVSGELHIGGAGLARGYRDRPDLTAERFIPDPVSPIPGARIYKTGDLARYLPDGTVEFLGRIDHQVKVRGFRIELGEIEAALMADPQVREAVVVAREARQDQPGDLRLVAYVVPRKANPPLPTLGDLRAALTRRLPHYMLPTDWVVLLALPLTPNGKVDRRSLPPPGISERWERGEGALAAAFVAPRTPTEELLAGIWAPLLAVPRVGVADNFFTLGGHSLLATRLVAHVEQTFRVALPLRLVFEAPTVAGQAALIEALLSDVTELTPAIVPAPAGVPLPLSFSQERLWFIEQFEPGGSAYNLPMAMRCAGTLDLPLLAAALSGVVRRHGALRTTFALAGGQPVQVVAAEQVIPVPLVDLAGLPAEGLAGLAEKLVARFARRPFDLAVGPLLRAMVLRQGPAEHVLLLNIHHIVSDGWSMEVLIREVATLYRALWEGLPSPLPPLPIQYADYAFWQRRWLSGDVLAAQLGYWRQRLAEVPPVLDLPLDLPRPAVHTWNGTRLSRPLPQALGAGLAELSRRGRATLFMTVLAAWNGFLARFTGQSDFAVGTPVAGRQRVQSQGLIGFFVNTLVLRADLSGRPGFAKLLERVRETALGAYAHQDVPFERLLEELAVGRSLERTPLFQVMAILQQSMSDGVSGVNLSLPGLRLTPMDYENRTAKFDLTLLFDPTPEAPRATLGFNTDLFRADTIVRLLGALEVLLTEVIADPGRPLADLVLLSAAERHQLVVAWNDTPGTVAAPDAEACLHQLFEGWAAKRPGAVAAVLDGELLTYGTLDRRAGLLAAHLCALGVGPDVRVGLCLPRSFDLLVALLAVLKAGGAYVPLDPANPRDRLLFLVADSRVPVLLTVEAQAADLAEPLADSGTTVICLNAGAFPLGGEIPRPTPNPRVSADNLAYVIYTSGSTGTPNGVLVVHRGAVHLIREAADLYQITPESRVLQTASIGFDASVLEIFLALGHGASLCLVREEERLTPAVLADRLGEQKVTTAVVTPSLLSVLPVDRLGQLRSISVGGEACPPELAARWAPGRRFLNCYGPTEATIFATVAILSGSEKITIGRPIGSVQAYVVDRELQPAALGAVGELMIGGVGLARGYLDRPEKTAARFVPDPFSCHSGARLYRTSDLARFTPAGKLEFLGRLDDQVKVRGFRIELGEIESVLLRHPGLQAAVALAPADAQGDRRLVAYAAGPAAGRPSEDELRAFLVEHLPEYIVPSRLVLLDVLPTTPGGKLDRRALPDPDGARQEVRDRLAPRTASEHFVASLWRQVLGVREIGVEDDFFALGGNSIKGAILTNLLQENLGEYVYVVALFDAPTLEALARYLEENYTEAMKRVTGERVSGVSRQEDRVDAEMIATLRQIIAPLAPHSSSSPRNPRNRRAVFLLSPPRSGSTLLRVLLAGNPALFAPPELELLGFNSLTERQEALSGRWALWQEGTLRALMDIYSSDVDEARQRMDEAVGRQLSVREFYAQLQAALGDRLLVDKTPSYALDRATLARAEEDFEAPLYIHLLRHPFGMIRSFEKAKLDQVFFRPRHPFSRRQLAELIWDISQENILDHLAGVPAGRQIQLRFEEMVKEPEREMRRVCEFLGIPFAAGMLDPYAEKAQRMTDGIHQLSKMVGDVKFHEHAAIDPTVAESWKSEIGEDFLGEVTWRRAETLGYPRLSQPSSASSSPRTVRSPLVPLVPPAEAGSGRPLFLIHPAGGDVFCYSGLAREISPDRPVYGLAAPPLAAEDRTFELEERAAVYVEALISAQPKGPYAVGGWSLGGIFAWEVAQQLLRRGAEIELLVLLDTRAPSPSAPRLDQADLLASLAEELATVSGQPLSINAADLREIPEAERLRTVLAAAREAGAIPAGVGEESARDHLRVLEANIAAVQAYRPQPYPGKVLLVSATRRGEAASSLGWRALAVSGLEVVPLETDHLRLLSEPDLALLLRETLAGGRLG